ncbi:hypothetical protein HYQ45_005318 [Verticillium longisporum]|nr:hypothetical protein HYQ44_008711 [Verticillium longisporum]KAG7137355.1 hypothetical protein HYQ45_005318 [Verticillium longisporum]
MEDPTSFVDEIAAWFDIDPDSPVLAVFWGAFVLLAFAFVALAAFVITQWTEWYTGRFGSVTGPSPERGASGLKTWLSRAFYFGLYLDGCGIALLLVVLSPALAIVAMGLAPLIALGVGLFGMGGDEDTGTKTKPNVAEEKKGQ